MSLGDTVQERVANFIVQDFNVQQSVVSQGTPHAVVRNEKEQQYLIFGVDIIDDTEDIEDLERKIRGRFTMSRGDEIVEEIDNKRISTRNQDDFGRDLYLIYPISRDGDVEESQLEFSGLNGTHRWSITEMISSSQLDDYIRNPPNPTVDSFSIPDSVSRNSDTVPVEVLISSDTESTAPVEESFKILASSARISGSIPFTIPYSRGGTLTHKITVPIYPTQGPREETIRLNWGRETLSETLDITE